MSTLNSIIIYIIRLPAGPSFFLLAQKIRSKKKGLNRTNSLGFLAAAWLITYQYFTLRFSPRCSRAPGATKTYYGKLKQCPVFFQLEISVSIKLQSVLSGFLCWNSNLRIWDSELGTRNLPKNESLLQRIIRIKVKRLLTSNKSSSFHIWNDCRVIEIFCRFYNLYFH